jgi:hypothetical protein
MEAFMKDHEDCEISEEGIEVKKWMQEDWETNWKPKKVEE